MTDVFLGCCDGERTEMKETVRQLVTKLQVALRLLPVRRRAIFLALVSGEITYAELAARFEIDVAEVEREFAAALVALAGAADG